MLITNLNERFMFDLNVLAIVYVPFDQYMLIYIYIYIMVNSFIVSKVCVIEFWTLDLETLYLKPRPNTTKLLEQS